MAIVLPNVDENTYSHWLCEHKRNVEAICFYSRTILNHQFSFSPQSSQIESNKPYRNGSFKQSIEGFNSVAFEPHFSYRHEDVAFSWPRAWFGFKRLQIFTFGRFPRNTVLSSSRQRHLLYRCISRERFIIPALPPFQWKHGHDFSVCATHFSFSVRFSCTYKSYHTTHFQWSRFHHPFPSMSLHTNNCFSKHPQSPFTSHSHISQCFHGSSTLVTGNCAPRHDGGSDGSHSHHSTFPETRNWRDPNGLRCVRIPSRRWDQSNPLMSRSDGCKCIRVSHPVQHRRWKTLRTVFTVWNYLKYQSQLLGDDSCSRFMSIQWRNKVEGLGLLVTARLRKRIELLLPWMVLQSTESCSKCRRRRRSNRIRWVIT